MIFTEHDKVELELLRDDEINALVNGGLLPEDERWNPGCRDELHSRYPKLRLGILTGSTSL
jgi:hypothetical protein